MFSVFTLFLIPIGGGIPAGVLLARSHGIAWPITAGLYFVSDIILAMVFEPFLRLLVHLGRRIAFFSRFGAAIKLTNERMTTQFAGTCAGPISLLAISFGIDPMTGRTAALAAGHGIIAGWLFAIAGDMLYYAVIATATLQLNAYIKNPTTTVSIILFVMLLIPFVVGRLRSLAPDSA